METCSRKKDLSSVYICEKLITDYLGSFDTPFSRLILAGAFIKRGFEVMETQITVLRLLWLKASPWITTTGRRLAGSDPLG
jgi:propanediol dehydratase large subunit